MTKHYKAPWSTLLIIVSLFVTILCVSAALGLIVYGRGLIQLIALLPLSIIFGTALFTVRGYQITPEAIFVNRLFWKTPLPIDDLESVEYVPNAMRRSLRVFGNGGLFAFTGSYNNNLLGSYRAFVTDLHLTVILKFPTHIVVISPARPEEFVQDICSIRLSA